MTHEKINNVFDELKYGLPYYILPNDINKFSYLYNNFYDEYSRGPNAFFKSLELFYS